MSTFAGHDDDYVELGVFTLTKKCRTLLTDSEPRLVCSAMDCDLSDKLIWRCLTAGHTYAPSRFSDFICHVVIWSRRCINPIRRWTIFKWMKWLWTMEAIASKTSMERVRWHFEQFRDLLFAKRVKLWIILAGDIAQIFRPLARTKHIYLFGWKFIPYALLDSGMRVAYDLLLNAIWPSPLKRLFHSTLLSHWFTSLSSLFLQLSPPPNIPATRSFHLQSSSPPLFLLISCTPVTFFGYSDKCVTIPSTYAQ